MIDPITAFATAQAAIKGVQAAIKMGKDINAISGDLMKFFEAKDVVAKEAVKPKGFAKSLRRSASDNGDVRNPTLKPGGRLIREWNGATHVVDVVDGGFLWNGQRFASLSPIASAITGARWSGPRFFGLKRSA